MTRALLRSTAAPHSLVIACKGMLQHPGSFCTRKIKLAPKKFNPCGRDTRPSQPPTYVWDPEDTVMNFSKYLEFLIKLHAHVNASLIRAHVCQQHTHCPSTNLMNPPPIRLPLCYFHNSAHQPLFSAAPTFAVNTSTYIHTYIPTIGNASRTFARSCKLT